jgi:hypothetical protein
MDNFDTKITTDLIHGLSLVHKNLLNFVFAALMLGISCKNSSSSIHKSGGIVGILASVFHEGMPMLIFSQILGWGQSAVCLSVICISQSLGYDIPNELASMVPLGLEAGTDVSSTIVSNSPVESLDHKNMQLAIMEETESLGLIIMTILFIILVSLKPYIVTLVPGNNSTHRDSIMSSHTAGTIESFEKPIARAASEKAILARGNLRETSPTSNHSADHQDNDNSTSTSKDREIKQQDIANLGTHLSLIALCVFVAFILSFILRLLEIYFETERRLFSNLRMFKIAMFCALFGMYLIQRKSRVVFIREWFMRLSGLMLDLMVISAFSIATPISNR